MSQIPDYLSVLDKYAAYRPLGEYTLDETVEMIDEALAFCVTNEIGGLLVDITGVTGFPPATTTERFYFATKWSATAAGRVYLSMIAPPEMIDSDRIGVTMGKNRGLSSEVFTDETKALQWLRTVCP